MGTTANRGWPYPENSDFVADGATAIENLADAIDDGIGRGYIYVDTVYFTSSGSFTKASYPWLRAVRVRAVGGGGSGASEGSSYTGAGGGGGGGYAEKFSHDIATMGASVTVTIGAGGAIPALGANDGFAGGTTEFGTGGDDWHTRATGGAGGTTLGEGGDPGVGNAGELLISGQGGGAGGVGDSGSPQNSGAGGGSILGGGGRGRASRTSGGQGGGAGGNYGGGGGGAVRGTSNAFGGAGADGIVIVELYA